jgi:hypothetical protein|nr:MAG TPA: hypothetical protein [Caudoviricetes sp.]
MSNKSNKVKVPGGAFYAGDGLTVDPITRTVSAGGGGDSGVTTLHIYISAIDEETLTATFTADKTPEEMFETKLPTWCVVTFAPGTLVDREFIVCAPPAFNRTYIAFGYIYDIQNGKNKWFVCQDSRVQWKLDLTVFAN